MFWSAIDTWSPLMPEEISPKKDPGGADSPAIRSFFKAYIQNTQGEKRT